MAASVKLTTIAFLTLFVTLRAWLKGGAMETVLTVALASLALSSVGVFVLSKTDARGFERKAEPRAKTALASTARTGKGAPTLKGVVIPSLLLTGFFLAGTVLVALIEGTGNALWTSRGLVVLLTSSVFLFTLSSLLMWRESSTARLPEGP